MRWGWILRRSLYLYRVNEVKVPFFEDCPEILKRKVVSLLGVRGGDLAGMKVLRRSLDARKKERMIYYVYNLVVRLRRPVATSSRVRPYSEPEPFRVPKPSRMPEPLVVGMGPCGLFCALALSEAGVTGTLIDRGCPVEERVEAVERLWKKGTLDTYCNPQFGEGGAGTFSDGKLTTRVRDPRIQWIFEKLVEFGAPRDILYEAKPHVGTDIIRGVVKRIREHLVGMGWKVSFRTALEDVRIEAGRLSSVRLNGDWAFFSDVVLAVGHSARDTYRMLAERGIPLAVKPFAVGFRVEHPQRLIDEAQYGRWAGHHGLPPASYHLTANFPEKRGVYTFCMCPGGHVICASSEDGRLVVNGMSYRSRGSGYANSAIVITVDERDFPGGVFGGLVFQERLEEAAYGVFGSFVAPCQSVSGFLGGRGKEVSFCTYRPGVGEWELGRLLPSHLVELLRSGIRRFARAIKGFDSEGVLVAVETRTSAPLRILRGEDGQSPAAEGLYPAGEGSGYSGGIVSSALDGVRVAQLMLEKYA